jgi:hypothetical protein
MCALWTERSSLQYFDTMPLAPVLIVGAGPSGLNLALALIRRNVQFRLISEAGGPGEESRAMAVQARTLEFYGQIWLCGGSRRTRCGRRNSPCPRGWLQWKSRSSIYQFQRDGRWAQPVSIRTRLSVGLSQGTVEMPKKGKQRGNDFDAVCRFS